MTEPDGIEVIRYTRLVPYTEALDIQLERWDAVVRGQAPDALLLLEHPPVITLGREARQTHLLADPQALREAGVETVECDRGGDVTYHGPGQLVGYPIIDLRRYGLSIRSYIRALEEALIQTLARHGVEGRREEGLTGVWHAKGKAAAIGVRVRRWTAYHGVALNVDPNMDHFKFIVPCGIQERPVTSLREILETPVSMDEIAAQFSHQFLSHFANLRADAVTGNA